MGISTRNGLILMFWPKPAIHNPFDVPFVRATKGSLSNHQTLVKLCLLS